MSTTRNIALVSLLVLGGSTISGAPALAFGVGAHGGGGGFGGHAGGFGGGHPGGFARGSENGGVGGDRVFTGRSVGIDRGGYGRGFYRGGRWFGYDCSPLGVEEGLCPAGDDY